MPKVIQIENWNKINGITYKGFVIGAPTHSPNYQYYNCNVYNLNDGFHSNSPISVTMKWDEDINSFNVSIYDTQTFYEHTELLPRARARVALGFVKVFEALIDQYIYDKRHAVGGTTGIIGKVMNSGTAVTYSFAPQGVSGSNGLAGSSNFNKT